MGRAKPLTGKQVREQGRPTISGLSIKAIREWVGMSQAELARQSGIPRTAIADFETDRYKMSASDGAELFMALARVIPPESAREREKTIKEAFRLLEFQKRLYRGQIDALERQRKEIEAKAVELDAKEARLRELQ